MPRIPAINSCSAFFGSVLLSLLAVPLQARPLVVRVEDEKGKPVKGMEVLCTGRQGQSQRAAFDPQAGVYRFAAIGEGAGAVTAAKKGYRIAGCRWFTQAPDTVRFVSLKGGELLYETAGRTYRLATDNRTARVTFNREARAEDNEAALKRAGLALSPALGLFLPADGSLLDELDALELEKIRNYPGTEEAGVMAWIVAAKATGEGKWTRRKEREYVCLSNRVTLTFRSSTPELVDSVLTQFGLVPDAVIYGKEITLKEALAFEPGRLSVIHKSGTGSCMIDQLMLIRSCPYIAQAFFTGFDN